VQALARLWCPRIEPSRIGCVGLNGVTNRRDGVNPLAALRTSPKDELKRARSTVPPDVVDLDDDESIARTWSDVSDMNHFRPHTSMA
jgi:hypothetical protein